MRVESIGKLHYRDAVAPTGFDRQINPMHLAGGIGQVWGSVRDPLPRRRGAHLLVSWSGGGETDYTRYDRHSTELACEWLAHRGERRSEPWVLYLGLVVDRRAKADQAALVERFGGPEVAVELGTVAETPVPQEVTEVFQ